MANNDQNKELWDAVKKDLSKKDKGVFSIIDERRRLAPFDAKPDKTKRYEPKSKYGMPKKGK